MTDPKSIIFDTFRTKGESAVRELIFTNSDEFLPAIVDIAFAHMRTMAKLGAINNLELQRPTLVVGTSPRSHDEEYVPPPQTQEHKISTWSKRPKVEINKCPFPNCGKPGFLTIEKQGNNRYPIVMHGHGIRHYITTIIKKQNYTIEAVEKLIAQGKKVEHSMSKAIESNTTTPENNTT